MADISMVDSVSVFQRYVSTVGKPTKNYNTGETEWHGPCPHPGCGGTDRFMFTNTGRFSCSIRASGCGWHGDVIAFLMEMEHFTYLEACESLGVDPGSKFDSATIERLKRHLRGNAMPPSKKWQDRAQIIIHAAQKCLWSPRGTKALQYLRERGFTDETIKQAELGYIPLNDQGRWHSEPLEKWGLEDRQDKKKVWLYEGILIPWRIAGEIWRLNVRRLTGLKEDDPKYLQILGSGEGLYGADDIDADIPVALVESELDALSGRQQAGDIATFVATGGVSRARRDQWLAMLSMAPCVLLASDNDANSAGDNGADAMQKLLPKNSMRWTPWSHDLNNMLREGKDIRTWVKTGVATYQLKEKAQLPDQGQPMEGAKEKKEGIELVDNCCICWADINHRTDLEFYYESATILYCENHVPDYLLVRLG